MGITPSQQRCIEAAHPFFGVKLDIIAKEGWDAFFETAEAFAIDMKQWVEITLHVLSLERSEVDLEDHRAAAKRLFFALDPDSVRISVASRGGTPLVPRLGALARPRRSLVVGRGFEVGARLPAAAC